MIGDPAWEPVPMAAFEPFNQGDVLVYEGCGGVEIATGVLGETRLPKAEEARLIRRAIEVSARRSGRRRCSCAPVLQGWTVADYWRCTGCASHMAASITMRR